MAGRGGGPAGWRWRWWRLPATLAAVAAGAGLVLWTRSAPALPSRSIAAPPTASSPAPGPSLRELSRAAAGEGQLKVLWPGGPTGRQRAAFETAFNREFGLHVSLDLEPGNAGQRPLPPPAGHKLGWDVLIGGEADYARLDAAGMLGSQPWAELFGAPAQAVLFHGGAISFAQQLVRPAYNTRLVPASATPHSWQALLDPRWKGRIGMSVAARSWALLSAAWGDGRTAQFVQALAAQQPLLAEPDELAQRLEQGQLAVVADEPDALLQLSLRKNAPVAAAVVAQPVLEAQLAGPLTDAPHPNAALLFAGFLATQEGQTLWRDATGESSVFVPGSPLSRLLRGVPYVQPSERFLASELPTRQARYAALLRGAQS